MIQIIVVVVMPSPHALGGGSTLVMGWGEERWLRNRE